MNPEALAALLTWAVQLSGYPQPEMLPTIEYRPTAWLRQEACSNSPCNVLGWYRDDGVIYVDARLSSRDDSFTAALLVHEMVHFLQHQSSAFSRDSCTDYVTRENEAYKVQNDYLVLTGNPALVFPAVWMSAPCTPAPT